MPEQSSMYPTAMSDREWRKARWRAQFNRLRPVAFVYHYLGARPWSDSMPKPPGDWLEWRPATGKQIYDNFVGHTGDDGSTLWLAYRDSDSCLCGISHKQARSLAWFILWNWWARGTWFGLRRKLWYWALFKKVNETRRAMPMHSLMRDVAQEDADAMDRLSRAAAQLKEPADVVTT